MHNVPITHGSTSLSGAFSEGEGATMTRPWRLDHSTVLDGDGNPVAIIADPAGDGNGERIDWPWVYDEALPESHVQAEANAALIAAAPDLLAALQDLMAVEGGEPGVAEELSAAWLQALNAIAKATGETA